MTLSRFLRDYLYIPLGGSHYGLGRAIFATMVTMLLGGIWHGASWSFLIWGGLHGVFLVINRFWGMTPLHDRLANLAGLAGHAWFAARVFLTFNAVCLAWCFFRLTNLDESLECVRKWIVFDTDKLLVGGSADLALWLVLAAYGLTTIIATIVTRGAPLPEVAQMLERKWFVRGLAWGGSASLVLLAWALAPGGQTSPFIYFQF
jgi:D-alanyl-lipoteichoic acid acyltransferase DltB (MBOAT superfamily)